MIFRINKFIPVISHMSSGYESYILITRNYNLGLNIWVQFFYIAVKLLRSKKVLVHFLKLILLSIKYQMPFKMQ